MVAFNLVPGLLGISLFVFASVAGLILVQRIVPIELRKQHNNVAGFIYAVVGIAYAVLLGLVVVAAWEQYQMANDTTEREANELAELFWLGQRLPPAEGHHLQELTRSYARVVVDEEWPLMARGESSPRAWALIDEIRLTVQNLNPDTEAGQVLYEQGLERVHDLADAGGTGWWKPSRYTWHTLGRAGDGSYHHHRLHVPVRAGRHYDAHADGRVVGVDCWVGTLHYRLPGVPFQGRRTP